MKNTKPYDNYKPSGIAWLGDIPQHWEVRKLKYSVSINNGADYKHIQTDSGYPVIGSGGRFAYAKEFMYDGEVIFLGRKGTIDKPLYFNGKFWAVDTMFYAYCKKGNNTKFHYYCATQIPFKLYGTSTALPSMTQTDLKGHYLAYPPLSEQTTIARFLDYKLNKIDRFILKKKKLIQLLNEQKAAIINDAVTKGLDPSVKMKDSGVEWLGDVPEHWEVRKLKYSVRLNKHRIFDNDENITVKIALENIESKTGRLLNLNENAFEGVGTIFKNGDVLFGKLRPYLAKVTAPNFEGSCVNEILVLSPNHGIWYSDFLKYRMLSSKFIKIVDDSTYGSKMPRASWDFIGSLKISCPSVSEQKAIVLHIEKETATLNQAIATIEKEIALVQEYRTTLIAEAVTGKIQIMGNDQWELDNEAEAFDIEGEMGLDTEGGEEE